MVGTFEVLITISSGEDLLPAAARSLSVFKHIATKIASTSRWHPIFERYLEGLAGQVRGLGGDPSRVPATPTGEVDLRPSHPSPVPARSRRECREMASRLLECLGCLPQDVTAVRVRRITVDIDLKDDEC